VAGAACQLVLSTATLRRAFRSGNLPEGLECARWPVGHRFAAAAPEGCAPEGIEQHLGRYADIRRDVFTALNTALWEDGAYLRIRRGGDRAAHPSCLYVSAGAGAEIMTHPRTLIVAETASQAAMIEDYVSLGSEAAFSNAVTELAAGQDAVVSHFLVERENLASFNVSTLRIEQARGANVDSHSILAGRRAGAQQRASRAQRRRRGVPDQRPLRRRGTQHIDNYMLVEHAQPHCNSRQFYNGILADHARGVFHGRIVVHKDAQKTDAKQTNRNLLLSDNARIDTKPQLEIYADDVKCTHGATIGQIEEDAALLPAFARLSPKPARNTAALCLCRECLDRMKEPAAREFAEG
jgi:Fe-S cluster assembly protein SufD